MSVRLRRLGMLVLVAALLSACRAGSLPLAGLSASPSPVAAAAAPAGRPGSAAVAPSPTAPSPSATAAGQRSATATPPAQSATAASAGTTELATLESLAQNGLPRRDAVALAYQYGRTADQQRVVREQPLDANLGDSETFWIADLENEDNYEIEATLVLALEHALVYVENGVDVDREALERDARIFNDEIYPRNRELFGSEWTPGIDGDPRLTILNARIPGAGGYFSSSDEVPRAVNRFSNEREMFYINVESYPPGSEGYLSTLAHEFQHMIQYNEAERPTTWLNEGLSQLAEELNGFSASVANIAPAFLADPDLQLTDWGASPQESLSHYGASYLFASYMYQQYGAQLDLKRLIKQGAGEQLEVFAELARAQNPAIADFGDLYADWATANLLNAPALAQGRYAYDQLPATVEAQPLGRAVGETVAQFGSDYWSIGPARQGRVLRFDGSDTIGVVDAEPAGAAMWWSNRGDSASSTLEQAFDLRNVAQATLEYRLWFDIEAGWDYAYVAVSSDGGTTWQTLEGQHTTTDDPQGANQGNGYTGTSGGGETPQWVDESIDLSAYAGTEIVLRFSLVTDDATNRPGMVIDDLRIPEISFSDNADSDDGGWQARGFARTDNRFPQRWELRFVRQTGNRVTVEPLTLDGENRAQLSLAPGERGTLIVMATTPHTTERATYRIEN